MKKPFYTDKERFEFCRLFTQSGLNKTDFCIKHNLNYSTFSDWISAYRNINGKFINVSKFDNDSDALIKNDSFVANLLSDDEIIKKSSHFSRFDHSVVVIEIKGIKITTSLEQAEAILERILWLNLTTQEKYICIHLK